MKVLTFSDENIWDIYKLLAGILHLGNIQFVAVERRNLESTGFAQEDQVSKVSRVLEVKTKITQVFFYFRNCVLTYFRVFKVFHFL